jgi:hypothetical protein
MGLMFARILIDYKTLLLYVCITYREDGNHWDSGNRLRR